MKLRRAMKAQNPKKKEKNKEINNNNKEKRKGSWLGQRTCIKDPDQKICSRKSIKALGP